mmetsp:Transcript_8555/g.21382  ORF Transcript_8555/g.21382 Transcript_8555/m.21382 type:complete len:86 (+) Transcript_8555:4260-4517(+)
MNEWSRRRAEQSRAFNVTGDLTPCLPVIDFSVKVGPTTSVVVVDVGYLLTVVECVLQVFRTAVCRLVVVRIFRYLEKNETTCYPE